MPHSDRHDPITDAALRARSGDPTAAASFVRLTQVDVWRFVAGLSSRHDADDLTQETYARAFASLRRFSGRSNARTWLLSIARRVCADAVRTAVRDRRLDATQRAEFDAGARHVPDPASLVATHAMLAALDPQRREAFVLTQLVGLSYAEAADVCNCPVGTIRSRVARARNDLVAGLHGARDQGATGSASG